MEGPKGLSLLLLVSLCVLLLVGVTGEDAEGATITVPDDYPTINSAVENATDYDTLFIRDGNYTETVVIWRPLTVVGESRDGTVIWSQDPFAVLVVAHRTSLSTLTVGGTNTGAGLVLQASGCTVEDVTVRESLWGLWVNRGDNNVVRDVDCLDNEWQGLLVEEADGTLLEGVTCSGNNEGIQVRAAVGTVISDCVSEHNRIHGLRVERLVGFYETRDLQVLGCRMSNNSGNGVEVSDTDNVLVQGCTVSDNLWSGMRFDRCNDVTVRNNHVRNYVRVGLGVQGDGQSGSLIEGNTITDEGNSWSDLIVHGMEHNVIRGNYVECLGSALSVLWANHTLVSGNDVVSTKENESRDTVGIIVGRHRAGVRMPPTNVTLTDNRVTGFRTGIRVRGGWDIDLIDCTVEDADTGIHFQMFDYGDDPIVGGLVRGCTLTGCGMVIEGMLDVTVEGNTIEGAETGIFFNATARAVKDNLFRANVIRDCSGLGLDFNMTNGTNRFHLNTFANNTGHSNPPMDTDAFDDGAMYGNYWDDYEERYPDATAVGRVWDTPYSVGGGTVTDRYPLAFPYDTTPPAADAGEQQGGDAGSTYRLNGTGSWDDGTMVRWTWTFEYADTPVSLEGEVATFPFLLIGSYEVTLEVEDAWGNTDTNTTMVHIHDLTAPNADAGEDVRVGMGEPFDLDGGGSTDNGIIVSWEWHLDPAGIDRVLTGTLAGWTIDEPGEYPVVLRVTDEGGNVDVDDMTVTVVDTEAPVADAGRDLAVDQGDTVTLTGRWCTDNVAVTSWTWTFTEEGVVVIEVGPGVDRVFPFAGEYEIFLNVTDAEGNWDVDQFTLTVRDTEPPVADAGEDVKVDQGTLVTLDGTGSTDNVAITGFNWMFAEGSAIKSIVGAEPSYRFDVAGEFELELQAYDAAGNIGLDWVIVTVDAVETHRVWDLGPFRDEDGSLGGVRVEVTLSGNSYVAYTDDGGIAEFMVAVDDLVSPASVLAEKEGWHRLEFDLALDDGGDPTGSIPEMEQESDGGGENGLEEEIDWLAWGLVFVLIIAFAGTLLYLSAAADRAKEG